MIRAPHAAPSLLARLRRPLSNERGSLAGSFVFVIFVSLVLTAVVTSVAGALTASTASGNLTGARSGAGLGLNAYLAAGAPSTAPQQCSLAVCGQVTAAADGDGTRSATVQGSNGDRATLSRIQPLARVDATMITGFDADGNPVWANQADTTPYRFARLVSAGSSSCGLDAAGAAWCWGANSHGELGDGTTTDRSAPVKVQGSAKLTALSGASGNAFCGLDASHQAWCWGQNSSGQLGDGTTADRSTPVAVAGSHAFTALYQGLNTTCGTDTSQQTWCWGANTGDSTGTPSSSPVQVSGTHDFASLSLDANTACGLETGGAVYCWAGDANGRTGVDPAPAPGTPVVVASGKAFSQVAVGANDDTAAVSLVCARDTADAAWCWGTNGHGQLGNGTTTDSATPVAATGSHAFSALAVASDSVCGLDTGSHAWCWGDNAHGQVGNGTTADAKDPAAVDAATTYSSLAVATGNGAFACGLASDGTPKCWGQNGSGQASPGTTADATSPAALPGLTGIKALSLGTAFGCALDARSEASCWGQDTVGQTGTGASSASPAAPSPAARQPYSPSTFTGYLKGGK